MTECALYGLVLAAAVAHAIWNAVVKSADDRLLLLSWIRLIGLLLGLVVLPFVEPPARASWPWLIAAAAAHYVYFALLIRSYSLGDLSHVYPIARGLGPLLLAAAAFILLGESLTLLQLAAVASIAGGLLALVLGRHVGKDGTAFAVVTGVSIAVYSFLGGAGVRESDSVFGFAACLEILTGVGMVAFGFARRRTKLAAFLRGQGAVATGAGAIAVGGYLAYLFCATLMPLATVAAVRESSVIFGAVIGAVFLKERFGPRRLIAAMLVTAGVVGLALFGA
jgi:drug/metabolite transporter (DMT)-like permease